MMRVLLPLAILATVSDEALAAPCKAPPIQQGMTYKTARAIVIRSGFQAPPLPPMGCQKGDGKVVSDCGSDVKLCNTFPEIDACSGQGQCNMIFSDAYGNKLSIQTYGDGPKGAEVSSFEMECKK